MSDEELLADLREALAVTTDTLTLARQKILTLLDERTTLERTVGEQNDVIRELRAMVERAHAEPAPDGAGFAPHEMARFRAPKGD